MIVSATLKSRWSPAYDKHGLAVAARQHFHNALDARDAIEAKRVELAGANHLSDIGRAQEAKKVAATEAARIAKAGRALTAARAEVRKQRVALTPTVKDKTDAAAAALRHEIRATLRGMSHAELTALVTDPQTDSIVLEALFEGPTILTGLDQARRDELLELTLKTVAAPAVAALAEQSDALDLLDAAVRTSMDTLLQASGVAPHGDAFNIWLGEVAPADAKEREAEAVQFSAEAIKTGATLLPLAERISLVDSLLQSNTDELRGKAVS